MSLTDARKIIHAYYPSNGFIQVSVTGKKCALHCDHCNARYLEHMVPATAPRDLYRVGMDWHRRGGRGMLISGGSTPEGVVPLGPFLDTIRALKKETGLLINVHTGLMSKEMADEIKRAGVDAVSLDLVGSDETIRKVYHLDRGVGDYESSLKNLVSAGVSVSPHITIGLHYGRVVGEYAAVDMVARLNNEMHDISDLVFLVLIPTEGTAMENTPPPEPEDVKKVITYARENLPVVRLVLGCMRPPGWKYEMAALEGGVDDIVLPSLKTRRVLRENGCEIKKLDGCCVFRRRSDM